MATQQCWRTSTNDFFWQFSHVPNVEHFYHHDILSRMAGNKYQKVSYIADHSTSDVDWQCVDGEYSLFAKHSYLSHSCDYKIQYKGVAIKQYITRTENLF